MADITDPRKLNTRRERSYPRVVKRARHNPYRVKKPGQHGTHHDAPATIKLLNPVLTKENTHIAALPNKLSGIELCTDCGVTDPTWAKLAERWPAKEILEFLMTIGFYYMVCGIHNSVGLQLDEGVPGWPNVSPA
jgi:hypothetical protein